MHRLFPRILPLIKRIKEVHDSELATRAAWLAQDRAKEAKKSVEMMLHTSMEAFLGGSCVLEPQRNVSKERRRRGSVIESVKHCFILNTRGSPHGSSLMHRRSHPTLGSQLIRHHPQHQHLFIR